MHPLENERLELVLSWRLGSDDVPFRVDDVQVPTVLFQESNQCIICGTVSFLVDCQKNQMHVCIPNTEARCMNLRHLKQSLIWWAGAETELNLLKHHALLNQMIRTLGTNMQFINKKHTHVLSKCYYNRCSKNIPMIPNWWILLIL